MIAPNRLGMIVASFVTLAAVATGGVALGHSVSPRIQVRTTRVTPAPNTVTATVTTTSIVRVVKTTGVIVPSPVYVTVSSQPTMTQYEAAAYCNNLAVEAWPDGQPTGDPLLDQMGAAYTNLQRERTVKTCMADHGY
jgi:hypothetical protein